MSNERGSLKSPDEEEFYWLCLALGTEGRECLGEAIRQGMTAPPIVRRRWRWTYPPRVIGAEVRIIGGKRDSLAALA